MGMDVGERYMNHAGAYRTSNTDQTDDNDDRRDNHDLDEIRDFLEASLERAPRHEAELALGMGDSYRDAHQDALDSIPEDIKLGDIDSTVSAEYNDCTAVALQYTADDNSDWIEDELQRLDDEYGET